MARRYYDDYFNPKPNSSSQKESSNQNEQKTKRREAIRKKKFVRYDEGAELYSMCKHSFMKLAAEAGALYKVNRISLVNMEVFEEYLETFRIL